MRVSLSTVFTAAFLPNLLLFAIGQAAAWFYLRSGRFLLGVAATVALWVLADWVLVAKYLFGRTDAQLQLPLGLLQAVALATAAGLAFGQWRRRWSKTSQQRPQLFAAGLAAYLRADYAVAQQTLRRLVRNDPWDAAAWAALADVLWRSGQPGRARAAFRRAQRVDLHGEYADFVGHQLAVLGGPPRRPRAAPAVAVAEPVAERT